MAGEEDDRAGEEEDRAGEEEDRAGEEEDRAGGPEPGPAGRDRWLTAVAFVALAVPFLVILLRLLTEPASGITLPDDLALIDLHTRDALHWHQQLGVFDRFGWNHPGPAYFYWLSLVYRVLGSGPRALFVGSTLLNGAVAAACLGVVRRRSTPARTLWAALVLSGLVIGLAVTGPGATTYSEGPLGGLVSPWNPMVVIFPLVLLVLLAAGAAVRSAVSWWGALAAGSFVVQTNISTLPLVAVVVVASGAVVLGTAWADRRRREAGAGDPRKPRTGWTWALGGLAAGATVLMWIPPLAQQLGSNPDNPGNLALLVDFFTAGHPGQPLGAAVWATVAVLGSYVLGPTEVMTATFSGAPAHPAVAALVAAAVVVGAAAAAVVGVRTRRRFGAALGGLTVLGVVVVALSVTRVTGFLFGYLVVWAVSLAATGLLAVGTLPVPRRLAGAVGVRVGLGAAAVALAVGAVVAVSAVPPLSRVSDPEAAALTRLVVAHLRPGQLVTVTDAGAGSPDGNTLLDLEHYIGLVNQLDVRGFRPRVSPGWRTEFGPRLVGRSVVRPEVVLSPWTSSSTAEPGYLGRVGDMAVSLTPSPATP